MPPLVCRCSALLLSCRAEHCCAGLHGFEVSVATGESTTAGQSAPLADDPNDTTIPDASTTGLNILDTETGVFHMNVCA